LVEDEIKERKKGGTSCVRKANRRRFASNDALVGKGKRGGKRSEITLIGCGSFLRHRKRKGGKKKSKKNTCELQRVRSRSGRKASSNPKVKLYVLGEEKKYRRKRGVRHK